ncbi:MAG: hypothetical protein WCE43_06320 [Burkholderiales bacterium]
MHRVSAARMLLVQQDHQPGISRETMGNPPNSATFKSLKDATEIPT